jgi:uncharacterized small protein (DUF1192 family)
MSPIFSGTPPQDRSTSYVEPPRSRRLLWWSLLFGFAILTVISAFYIIGARRAFSPGHLVESHARVEAQCVQCHQTGNAVEDLRCERCHDPGQSLRMTQLAHEAIGGEGGPGVAKHADTVACATCHIDHKGREFVMNAVDDRECAVCHTTVRSFARHPEFAAVVTGRTAGVGLKFNHDKHIAASPVAYDKVKTAGTDCRSCHKSTADSRNFEPMTFDATCAGSVCHTDGDKIRGGTTPHRDPQLVAEAFRLRKIVDPEGDLAERLALETRAAYANQVLQLSPANVLNTQDLERSIAATQEEIARLDAEIQSKTGGSPSSPEALVADAQRIAGQLAGLGDDALVRAVTEAAAPTEVAVTPAGVAEQVFAKRKEELATLLDAIALRGTESGNTSLQQRAEALKQRLGSLPVPPPDSRESPASAGQRVIEIDGVIQALARLSGPGDQPQLAQIDYLRRYAQQRAASGFTAAQFQAYQSQLLALLASIERRGGESVRPRVESLRQRVLSIRPGSSGDALARVRADQRRLLSRLLLERELKRVPGLIEAPSESRFEADRREAGAIAAQIAMQMRELGDTPDAAPAASEQERSDAFVKLDDLLKACSTCHVLDPSQARIAPVKMDLSIVPRSIFNHKPHLTATTKCEDCHSSVLKSQKSNDVDIPGVAQCQTCHAPRKTKDTCVTCHLYHPPSAFQLLK